MTPLTCTCEAEDVVWAAHGAAPRSLAHNPLPALDTGAQTVTITGAPAQRLEMFLLTPSTGA